MGLSAKRESIFFFPYARVCDHTGPRQSLISSIIVLDLSVQCSGWMRLYCVGNVVKLENVVTVGSKGTTTWYGSLP